MALKPVDNIHALQIQAGVLGRKAGHAFEDSMTTSINGAVYPLEALPPGDQHILTGDPALGLVRYVAHYYKSQSILAASAISTGALATSEEGQRWLTINGANVRRCKSDLVITLALADGKSTTVGVSTKQCNNRTPTNAQLYFTTARGFTKLLRDNGIVVSDVALAGLRRFCGDDGYRPLDEPARMRGRKVDPRRFFWEEIGDAARSEWETTLARHQDDITRLLLQKAYIDDPFVPDFKTRSSPSWEQTEVAVYAIDGLIGLSRRYQVFALREYSVRKGSHKDPPGVTHLAPRFGVVQMQRGGQAQHPEQLQFNLEAGYFYKI